MKRTVRKGKAALLQQDEAALLRARSLRSPRLLPLLKARVPGKNCPRNTTTCSARAGRLPVRMLPGKKKHSGQIHKKREAGPLVLFYAFIYALSASPQLLCAPRQGQTAQNQAFRGLLTDAVKRMFPLSVRQIFERSQSRNSTFPVSRSYMAPMTRSP